MRIVRLNLQAVRFFSAALACILPICLVVAADAPGKLKVPTKEQRDAKTLEIDGVFPVTAAQTAKDKVALAKKLLTTGEATQDDPAAQFVLFNRARELAVEAGDFDLALSAVAALDARFAIDVVALKVASLEQLLKSRLPDEAKRIGVVAGREVLQALLAAEEFAKAESLLANLSQLASRLKDRDAVTALTELKNRIKQMQGQFQQAQAARLILQEKPNDAAANMAVGRYYAFVQGDWGKAMTYLALGDNEVMKRAAALELQAPTDAAQRAVIADSWWEAAQEEKGHAATELKVRAAHWYRQAAPGLAGLSAEKARLRLKEAAELASLASADGEKSSVGNEPLIDKRGIEWADVGADGKLSRCLSVGPFAAETDDATIMNRLVKAKLEEDVGGRKVERKTAEPDGKIRGPLQPKSEQYYLFRVKSEREYSAIVASETFTRWGHSTIEIYVNFQPVPKTGEVRLKRGENIIVVKQNHNKSDRDDRSYIKIALQGEKLQLQQGY